MKTICGVYVIKNKINNKIYIGSSKNIYARWNSHVSNLKHNCHHSKYLQNSWNKYGEDAFEFAIIEECSEDIRVEREQYYLDYYQSYDSYYGYNSSVVAHTCVPREEDKLYGEKSYQHLYSEDNIKNAIKLLKLENILMLKFHL